MSHKEQQKRNKRYYTGELVNKRVEPRREEITKVLTEAPSRLSEPLAEQFWSPSVHKAHEDKIKVLLPTGKQLAFNEITPNDTVGRLKEEIEWHERIPSCCFRLVYNVKPLFEYKKLANYSIGFGSVIHLVLLRRESIGIFPPMYTWKQVHEEPPTKKRKRTSK